MRWLLAIVLVLAPTSAVADPTEVDPADLHLEVRLEEPDAVPHIGEMVMITIRGVYRRHITRETLVQPSLNGFNWSQLGPDNLGRGEHRRQAGEGDASAHGAIPNGGGNARHRALSSRLDAYGRERRLVQARYLL